MGEQLVGQSFGLGAKLGNGVADVDRIPEDDGDDCEVEARRHGSAGFRRCGPRISP